MSTRFIHWSIVVLLAVGITVLQEFAGPVVGMMMLALRILIVAGLVYFAYTLWRNNRARLQWLSGRRKLLFYGAAALIVLVVIGSFFITWTLMSTLWFFVVIGGCGYVMWRIWRDTAGWY